MTEQSYENVVPRHLRDIAEELGLEHPAWYVGRPPVETLIKASGNGNGGPPAAKAANEANDAAPPADSATRPPTGDTGDSPP